MEERKTKHYTNFSILIFISLILLGCVLALTLYQVMKVQTYIDINIYVFDVIVLIVGYITSVSLYFLGKYLFSLLGGYRLVSFNFWFVNFIKDKEGKIVVKRGRFTGLGCKVNMAPNREKPNYKLHLLGGMLFALPIFVIALVVGLLLHIENDLKYYLIFIFSFIPFVCVGNLIPLRLDSPNDGFLLRLIKKDGNPDMYHRNQKQYEALVNGVSTLEYYEYRTPKTPFEIDGLFYNYYYCLDHKEYTKALRICEDLISVSSDIIDVERVYLGYTGKIYELCRQKRFEESDRYFWELKNDIRSTIRNKRNFESIKICLFVAAYMETNYDEYLTLYYRKEKASKRYEYLSRIDNEVEVINETIKTIQVDHKDWYVE